MGDAVSETLPVARGGDGNYTYMLNSPEIPGISVVGRMIDGAATATVKAVHTYRVEDGNGDFVEAPPFTIEAIRLDDKPPKSESNFVETRVLLHIEPRGDKRGFSYWNGTNLATIDGVKYEPGEIIVPSDYSIDMQSTKPIEIEVEGADGQFRSWLIRGGSSRDAVVTFAIRETVNGVIGNWDTDIQYVGRVGLISRTAEGFSIEIDAEIYLPSQDGVTRMSDESQRSVFGDDEIYKHLKTMISKTEVWPS